MDAWILVSNEKMSEIVRLVLEIFKILVTGHAWASLDKSFSRNENLSSSTPKCSNSENYQVRTGKFEHFENLVFFMPRSCFLGTVGFLNLKYLGFLAIGTKN